ncbi:MAG TPA: DinB family protein [Pyrinomonadaceae bacterium]|nr:DinB family protein [Pyrinomonadaceae bacterium]
MSICESLAAELRQEAKTTRRILERVPEGSFDWKPHEKSMSLGRLAGHVAELPSLIAPALTQDELNFASGAYKPFVPTSTAELLERFDQTVNAAVELLDGQTDERMSEQWRLGSGDQTFFTGPRVAAVRVLALNHVVHHRGQLSVYLRLLDVPVPSIYGPSADEMP